MTISIWSKKGGVGKTTLAFNLAKDLDFFLISNDDSLIEKIYPKKAKILDASALKLVDNCVYDFGGFIDNSIQKILKKSDWVIVPAEPDNNSILQTFMTIDQLSKLGIDDEKIIVVINRVEKDDEFSDFAEKLKERKIKTIVMPRSSLLKKAFRSGETVLDRAADPFVARAAKKLIDAYSQLLETIKTKKGE